MLAAIRTLLLFRVYFSAPAFLFPTSPISSLDMQFPLREFVLRVGGLHCCSGLENEHTNDFCCWETSERFSKVEMDAEVEIIVCGGV